MSDYQETPLSAEELKYERFERLRSLVKVYVEDFDNIVGGNLHIVLSDGNMEARNIEWCISQAQGDNDHLGVAIGRLLLELPEGERDEWYQSGRSCA